MVIRKVCKLRNLLFQTLLPPCTCTYAISLHPLFPHSTNVRIVFLKEDMTDIYFANYHQSKNLKQRYKIKKLLSKAIKKCRMKTPKKALASSLHFLAVKGKWEWIILAI